jgi:adenylate cyclase
VNRRTRSAALAAFLGLGAAAAALAPPLLALEETVGLGALFALRGPLPAPTEVVVIAISRAAAAAVGETAELDTWPRSLHGALVQKLAAAGATTIVFDLIFDEARDAADDQQFAEALDAAGNVLLLERTESRAVALGGERTANTERQIPPLPVFKISALGSAPFVLPVVPIRVGRFWTFGRAAGEVPSLPVVALQAHLVAAYDDLLALLEAVRPGLAGGWPKSSADVLASRELEVVVSTIRRAFMSDARLAAAARAELARARLPPERAAALAALLDVYSGPTSRYLNLYGPARAVPTLPYDRALESADTFGIDGKTVFVGVSEPHQPEQQDDFYSVFSRSTGENLSGVEIGATAFANLREQRALALLPMPLHLLVVALLGALFAAFAAFPSLRGALTAHAVGAASYAVLAYWSFATHNIWLPLAVPLILQMPAAVAATVWWHYRELAAQRERVRTALGYYVPAAVAGKIAEQSLSIGAGGQLLHGTCLFTDAEQYTAVAERLTPEELAALMNDYYRAIFGVVRAHGGEISDTAGDSMVAVWATARPDATARLRAAQAALGIVAAVDEFNAGNRAERLPTRVGLDSGALLLGNIGAEQRYEYRAIGDIVNTASRIQALNQALGTRVLISGATLEGIDSLRTRPLGTFLLRGKRLPVSVHEPLAPSSPLDEREFAEALGALRAGQWHDAHRRFAALAERSPDDGPSRYYEALTAGYRSEPPAGWTGVIRVDLK